MKLGVELLYDDSNMVGSVSEVRLVKVKVSPITYPKGKVLLPSSRASSVRLMG
jgi:hypothetical protein